MGYYVHISVIFACDKNDAVAALAKKHYKRWGEDGEREAGWFLDDLAKRTGTNPGPKGGLALWGMVGNYTKADRFVEVLKPFFLDLLQQEVDGGPNDFEHILVFDEPEQLEYARAHEIFLSDDKKGLIVKYHEHLPFQWGQF